MHDNYHEMVLWQKESHVKEKNWIFTILYIVLEFVTETTADQKQMFDCLPCQSNYWIVWIEKGVI